MLEWRDITESEWNEYEWTEVTTVEDRKDRVRVFIRGVKYTRPPNDGYHYEEITAYGDTEQKWVRAKTPLS